MNKYVKDLMTLAHGEALADELWHFGIKGMKWGVRRYQNADGSLTPAGERRYYGKANAIQRDIDSFKPHKNGIKNKRGKTVLTKEEVAASVRGLEGVRDRARAKGDARRKKDYAKLNRLSITDKVRLNLSESPSHNGYKGGENQRKTRNRLSSEFAKLQKDWKKLEKDQDRYFSQVGKTGKANKTASSRLKSQHNILTKKTEDLYKKAVQELNVALAADKKVQNASLGAKYLISKGKGWTEDSVRYYLANKPKG